VQGLVIGHDRLEEKLGSIEGMGDGTDMSVVKIDLT
jgi:hypothetical protein